MAKDVCVTLGMPLNNGGTARYLQRLASDERRSITRSISLELFDGDSKAPSLTVVSESGLYKLTMRSDKACAQPFQEWVTREVLPSIRKTGAYVMGQPSIQENPAMDSMDLLSVPLL